MDNTGELNFSPFLSTWHVSCRNSQLSHQRKSKMLSPPSAKTFYVCRLLGLKQSIFHLLGVEVQGRYSTWHQLFPSFSTLVTVLSLTSSSREYNSRSITYSSTQWSTSKLFLLNPNQLPNPPLQTCNRLECNQPTLSSKAQCLLWERWEDWLLMFSEISSYAQGSCPLLISVVTLFSRTSREKWCVGTTPISEVLRQPKERQPMTLKPWNDTKKMWSFFLPCIKVVVSSTRSAETHEYWRCSAFTGILRSSLKFKRPFTKHEQDCITCCVLCLVRQLTSS